MTNVAEILEKRRDEPVPIKELKLFPFEEILKLARERGIDVKNKTRKELELVLSGEADSGAYVYDRKRLWGMEREEIGELKEKSFAIPDKTILPADPNKRKPWMKIIENNPMAFNGVDLTDRTGAVVHHLDSERDPGKIYCECGREIPTPRYDEKGNWIPLVMCPGVPKTIMDLATKKPMKRLECINELEFRKHVFHRVPEDA